MMTEFPYGVPSDAYLNVREAAKEPWRGITAWVQGSPYLVIDKDGEGFIVEGEDGNEITLKSFEKWEPATEQSALIAASRLKGSPFTRGSKIGSFEAGNLLYWQKEWHVRVGETGSLPLERLVARYDAVRWDKRADLMPKSSYRCPRCGSDFVSGVYHSSIDPGDQDPENSYCEDCGYEGPTNEFLNEEPDYDSQDAGFYEDWNPMSKVKTAEGLNTFDYNLPPHGIHFRTHGTMQGQGLSATVHYPPGVTPSFPEGFTSQVPGPGAMDEMFIPQEILEAGGNPEDVVVRVETPHDPEQVRQIFDSMGGRTTAKIAEHEDGVKCPKCGSHTFRAYPPPSDDKATLVCLTCGNEWTRDVMKPPESKVAVAPVDPDLQSQIIGLNQQIQQAYAAGDVTKARQLSQRLQQLLDNPNTPSTGQVPALMGFAKEEGCDCGGDCSCEGDCGCDKKEAAGPSLDEVMRAVQDDEGVGFCVNCGYEQMGVEPDARGYECENCGQPKVYGAEELLLMNVASIKKEAPGKEHMKGVSPKRNRQYEHILETCKKDHPDYSLERCKELAARTVNKTRSEKGETKSSIDKEGFDPIGMGTAVLLGGSALITAVGTILAERRQKGESVEHAEQVTKNLFLREGYAPEQIEQAMQAAKAEIGGGGLSQKIMPDVQRDVAEPATIRNYLGGIEPVDTIDKFFVESTKWSDDIYITAGPMDNDYSVSPPSFGPMSDSDSICPGCGSPVYEQDFEEGHCPMCGTSLLDPSTPMEGEFSRQAWYDGADDPYPPGPKQVNLDEQTAPEPSMMGGDSDFGYPICPHCLGPGMLHGQLGQKTWYRCRNCGADFYDNLDGSPINTGDASGTIPGPPAGGQMMASLDEVKDVNQEALKGFKDSSGNPLEAGKLYMLHHPEYKVPDIVKILNLEDNRIEAAIASDEHGAFPIHINHDDVYTLDPWHEKKSGWKVADSVEPWNFDNWKALLSTYSDEEIMEEWRKQMGNPVFGRLALEEMDRRGITPDHLRAAGGVAHTARRDFSAQEQRDLINENPEGRARNIDKLDLAGTHYNLKEESTDPYFLLGL